MTFKRIARGTITKSLLEPNHGITQISHDEDGVVYNNYYYTT